MKGPCKAVCVLLLIALGVRAHVEREQNVLDAAGESNVDNGVTSKAEMEMASRLGNRLHHKWGLWGYPNDKVHEDIINTGYSMLTATEKAVFDQATLTTGVRFPDMPTVTTNNYLDSVAFVADFKSPSNRRQLVFNSHYGCLQHWHAQGSVLVGPTLDLPSGSARYVFTNEELKGFMMGQAELWWGQAQSSNQVTRTFNIGRLLHMVHDSFPRGHTLRDETNTYPYMTSADPFDPAGKGKTMATGCGKIWYFQGYDAQHGNDAHANADKLPKPSDSDYKRLQCARYYSWKLLSLLARCGSAGSGSACAWANAKIVLDEVWQLADWAKTRKTAGAVDAYAATGLQAKGFSKVRYSLPGNPVDVWEPTSARLWGSAAGYLRLCPPIRGKAASLPYTESDFTAFYNPTRGTSPGAVQIASCFKANSNGQLFYKYAGHDCKCTNLVMTCKKSGECGPGTGGCPAPGVCRCQQKMPADTCQCVVPHPGTYPVVCDTESYGALY